MSPIEIGLSFLEGIGLIISPCILPVLPLVLSTSVEGGRRRPFGIITGFVLAFTLFALLSRKLVMLFNIDLDYIKYGSLILLGAFGLILLSETLSAKFSALTQGFASTGSDLSSNAKDGFFSGVLIGMLIGLVWTPCAGPILAAVLVQVIRQENDLSALFLVSSFALGAAVPMLAISLTGRSVMSKLSFFTTHAETVRKSFGVVILLAVAFIASGVDAQSLFSKPKGAESSTLVGLQNALPVPYAAPEFVGIDAWLNSQPFTMRSLKGKVVLVDFWTYSCINCVRTLPYITEWDRKYRDKGLVIVGVHAPEFEFEKNKANVEAAIAAHGIKYPVAQDNRLDTWTNFKNRYWPAHYLIDKEGRVVYTHFGEGDYDITESNIRFLLGLDKAEITQNTKTEGNMEQTPETYLGSERAENYSSPQLLFGNDKSFTFPQELGKDHWALSGKWSIEGEKIVSAEAGAKIRFNFNAGKVFLVLGTVSGKPVDIEIKLNGKTTTNITVKQHTLYELISQDSSKDGLLEITAKSSGLEAYAFTFGN